ncbi:ATP-binding protein [Ochrobactrum sp. MYb15]|uniref:DNA-packaging protein n=1 Tax=Brucella TaxID=234 RepID=UPI0004669842|nr:terminase family protein [Brucella rhizosphaerae]PQZ49552.1 ATP-binding protein [Ochrobactrum sp. MYb19]PRA57226.1 ATP-binding protein [Ochrobactrum sp. MYb68]PRA66630.1 ATP-binding protein [Ochrobactrum sp. MYb18]PRA76340.1 ATP-binding protein [Brucella thiophenivorans]PRA91640.1 ATP-binding protein [Ochrobactrum sp. MYb14]PRA98347.1 ATP-binding protein [Ochrobactrum sp. MYb15]
MAAECEWLIEARDAQLPPSGDWRVWLILGGRGSGKTRAGAEWVSGMALGLAPFATRACGHIALVGETFADAREVMVDGPSGILSVSRASRPRYETTRRRLLWDNGAVASLYSSEDPDGLRGPQFDAAWCDELAKWKNPQATWDMLQFGLRLGDFPRQVVTTTPRAVPLLKTLMTDDSVAMTHMRTSENASNLADGFMQAINQRYAGTRLGRQELDGELIEERAGALWSRERIEQCFEPEAPQLVRILVAVDPPASSGKSSDACGIVVAGIDENGIGHVLADESMSMAKPHQWARRAIALYHSFEADAILAEVNQGGEMVAAVLSAEDASVPVLMRRASRGKWLRAEPVAALYEQDRVWHAGRFPALEDEMCDFAPEGLSSGRSPDRLDALVWALGELMLGADRKPRIRRFG